MGRGASHPPKTDPCEARRPQWIDGGWRGFPNSRGGRPGRSASAVEARAPPERAAARGDVARGGERYGSASALRTVLPVLPTPAARPYSKPSTVAQRSHGVARSFVVCTNAVAFVRTDRRRSPRCGDVRAGAVPVVPIFAPRAVFFCGGDALLPRSRVCGGAAVFQRNDETALRWIATKMLGGASQIVSEIRVKCNGK